MFIPLECLGLLVTRSNLDCWRHFKWWSDYLWSGLLAETWVMFTSGSKCKLWKFTSKQTTSLFRFLFLMLKGDKSLNHPTEARQPYLHKIHHLIKQVMGTYQNSQTHLTKQSKTKETKTNKNWNCICFINMRYPICLLPFYAMMCNNEGFPFHQFNITYYSWCLVPVWRLQKVAPYYIIV